MPLSFRMMAAKDIPALLRIETASQDYPWTEEEFKKCLRNDRICVIAEIGNEVVGYIAYFLQAKQLYLLNFAVHPDYQRKGVGRAIFNRLISKMNLARRSRLVIVVRETNLVAQMFLQALGFKAVAVERSFFENGEDAYRMILFLQRPKGENQLPAVSQPDYDQEGAD